MSVNDTVPGDRGTTVIDLRERASSTSSRRNVVVTGAAGFIGSTLCHELLARGDNIVGIDNFTPYYGRAFKTANIAGLLPSPHFRLVEGDLLTIDLHEVLDGAEIVFHQAGQPGVRASWAAGFAGYVANNVLATQRLLEAVVHTPSVRRVVYASSSSVYGNRVPWPCTEEALPRPRSPYGVTKLAAEHLCGLYAENHDVPVVSLRYFTVYGPRQRPDMAIHRLIEAACGGPAFKLFGDGRQVRDFTYVGDIVNANLAAATADLAPGTVMNIAGVSNTSVQGLIDLVAELAGAPVPIEVHPEVPGDVERTGGSIAHARALLGWAPSVDLREGIAAQLSWQRGRASNGAPAAAPLERLRVHPR